MESHRHLDDELSSLRDRVLLLGGEAEQALERAMDRSHCKARERNYLSAISVEHTDAA